METWKTRAKVTWNTLYKSWPIYAHNSLYNWRKSIQWCTHYMLLSRSLLINKLLCFDWWGSVVLYQISLCNILCCTCLPDENQRKCLTLVSGAFSGRTRTLHISHAVWCGLQTCTCHRWRTCSSTPATSRSTQEEHPYHTRLCWTWDELMPPPSQKYFQEFDFRDFFGKWR